MRAGPAVNRAVRAVLLLTPLLGVQGCESVTGPSTTRVLGTIVYDEGAPEIVVPDTVEAGEPFDVSVVTTWPDDCAALDETEVRASGTEVHVIPWDVVTDRDDCVGIPGRFEHTVRLSRATPAELTLTVHGRRMQGSGRVDVQIVYDVVVREP